MAFSLKKSFLRFKTDAVAEFYLHITPLLKNEQVQSLENYIQHNCYSRLNHSLDVAYYSFFIAKLLRWDTGSTARGALLHDLYLYDRDDCEQSLKSHLRSHPKIALENARKVHDLNKIEEDIIRKHMWFATLTPPRYKESFIVTFVDKFCAVREGLISLRNRSWERTTLQLKQLPAAATQPLPQPIA